MKKRVVGLCLAIILAFSMCLTSCKPKDPNTAYTGTVLKFMAVAEPESDYLKKEIIPAFTKQTGIKVEIDETDYTKLYNKQVLNFTSGAYDVYQIDQMWVQEYAKDGWLADLTPYEKNGEIPASNYESSLTKICTVNGKLSAIPFSAIPVNFFYNKKMLSDAGLSAPQTWDDVLKNAKALTKDTNGDGNIDQWGVGIRGEAGNPISWTFLPIMWSYGAEVFNSKMEPVYNSKEAVAALEYFKELYKYSPPGWLSAQDVSTLMMQGQSAQMSLMSVYDSAMDDPAQSKVVNGIELTDMPKGPSGNSASILGLWTIGISAKSAKKEAAVQFLKYLSQVDVGKKMAFSGTIGPTMAKVLSDPSAPKYYAMLGNVLQYVQAPPLIPESEQFFDSFGAALQEAVSGQKTAQQALDDSVNQMHSILAKDGYYK